MGSNLLDLGDPFVRELWACIIPSALVILFCTSLIPVPARARSLWRRASRPFRNTLTLEQAEAYEVAHETEKGRPVDHSVSTKPGPPVLRTIALPGLALLGALAWLGVGSYTFAVHTEIRDTILPIVTAATWLYASIRPIVWPSQTIFYDLFALYLAQIVTGFIVLGGSFFDHSVYQLPLPSSVVLAARVVNLSVLTVLLTVVLGMPFAIPSTRINKDDVGKSVSPEDYCSLWDWISFHWVAPLIKKGTYSTLNEDDVWRLSPTLSSRPLTSLFKDIGPAHIVWKLWTANSGDMIWDFLLTLVSVTFTYAGPFFLQRILAAIDDPTPESRARAYIYAFCAFLATLLKTETDCLHLWFGRRAQVRIRTLLMASIYDKALKRKDFSGAVRKDDEVKDPEKANDPKSSADVGKVVNMMSGDANQIAFLVSGMYFIYGAPFEIVLAGVYLYKLLGWSAFSGLVVIVIFWPFNQLLARRSISISKGLLAARDKRMGVLNELLGAIKFIKFFAWEERWTRRTMNARKKELSWMVKSRINSVLFSAIWTLAPILVSVVSFASYIWLGNQLTVSVAFTAISLFTMVRAPLNVIPTWIVFIMQTKVALDRIQAYIDEDEVDGQVSSLKEDPQDHKGKEGLGIIKGSFKWNEVEEKGDKGKGKAVGSGSSNTMSDTASTLAEAASDRVFELRDISVLFPEGQLTVVAGPTASGKTALLLALLGEMTQLEGELVLNKNPSKVDGNGLMHCLSYAAQSPWLQHLTIKDNILFGSPLDEDRYEQVVDACALRPDLDMLEDGDATEIGARGVSLSGGQKARVALARAVYARTKYVLLDDPLSAVDSHTARTLFEKLLCGPLFADRTAVLVTHHVELVLPATAYLIRMLDGRIDVQGTPKDLRAQGVLEEITHDQTVQAAQQEEPIQAVESEDPEAEVLKGDAATAKDKKTPRKLVKDEHREEGSVKWSVYNTYLKATSYWSWAIIFVLIAIQQLATVGEKVWIKYWDAAYPDRPTISSYAFSSFITPEHEFSMQSPMSAFHHLNPAAHHHALTHANMSFVTQDLKLPPADTHPMFYVGVFAAIGIGGGLVLLLTLIVQYAAALKASKKLFKQLLDGVVHATMRWFDTTPQGRLLNRFSKDIETIDGSLAGTLNAVNNSLATFFSSVLVVTVIFPFFLLPASIIGYMYQRLAVGYLNTGRDLRRMESNSRSPIFSGFGEMLEGIVTVRAFGAEQRFLNDIHTKIDLTVRMFYNFWMLNRHLLLHFDALGGLGVLAATLFSLSGYVSAGTAGVCITSAMSFCTSVYWACRHWTGLELDLNSVERVVEYLDLPQEPPSVIESSRPPAYWPSSSNKDNLLVVEDLSIRYAPELPSVLHNVSLNLKAKERVGLLGRTGSGKSTLAMSILRFVDPSSGRIIIDGIDICTLGVSDLRSRITFIPQDATLFSGTLRENLDPFNEHEDAECLDALYRVQLITPSQHQSQKSSAQASRAASIHEAESAVSTVASVTESEMGKMKITLDTQVSSGGSNFSNGQRQLIAMARALLRRSAIIILDEATSSIDFATDAKIQATIREEFNDSLLLTVAHRLRTVIDYDRLVVLDKGKIAEIDTPYNLIRKEGGLFRSMCLKSGTFSELEATAKAKAESTQ